MPGGEMQPTSHHRIGRVWIAFGLTLAAVICMILSAYYFRPQPQSYVHYRPTPGPEDYYDSKAPWLFGGGVLIFLAALFVARPKLLEPVRLAAPLDALRPRWVWGLVAVGTGALLLMAEANGEIVSRLDRFWKMAPHVQLALLIAGIGCIIVGLGGIPRRRHPAAADDAQNALWGGYREIGLILLLTLIALSVRFWDLGRDVRVMVDEGHFALGTTYFWTFPDTNLLEPMPTSASFPFIFSYGQAGMVEVFGRNFTGLRALSALLGTLTIPALYMLARELFDRRIATLAALLLIALPPHIHYSRLALNNIADPLFGVLALAFLARGLRTRRRFDYVVSGAMLGLTQYFYEGGRILYPALIVGWLVVGFVLWRPRPSLRGVILLVLAFVLVAMPVYYTLYGRDFPFFDRMDKTELREYYWSRDREPDNLQSRLARLHHSIMLYISSPENTIFHYYLYYGGRHPMLLAYVVPVFFLGAVIALWFWRRPGGILLVGWMIGTSAGNALLVESAVTARYVVAFPAVALLLALGIEYPLKLLLRPLAGANAAHVLKPSPPAPPLPQGEGEKTPIWDAERGVRAFFRGRGSKLLTSDGLQPALAIAIALALAVGQIVFYYGPFIKLFNVEVRAHVTYDAEDAIQRSVNFAPGTEIWLIGEDVLPQLDSQRLMNYLVGNKRVVVAHPSDISVNFLAQLPNEHDYAFFVGPTDYTSLETLRFVFGDRPLQYTDNPDVPTNQAFLLFYVSVESRTFG